MNDTFLNKQNLFSKPIRMKMVKINNLLRSLTMVSLMTLTFSSSICCSYATDLTLSNSNEDSASSHPRATAFLRVVENLIEKIVTYEQDLSARSQVNEQLLPFIEPISGIKNMAESMLNDFRMDLDKVPNAENAFNHNGNSGEVSFNTYADEQLDLMAELYDSLDMAVTTNLIPDEDYDPILQILELTSDVDLLLKQMTPPRR